MIEYLHIQFDGNPSSHLEDRTKSVQSTFSGLLRHMIGSDVIADSSKSLLRWYLVLMSSFVGIRQTVLTVEGEMCLIDGCQRGGSSRSRSGDVTEPEVTSSPYSLAGAQKAQVPPCQVSKKSVHKCGRA